MKRCKDCQKELPDSSFHTKKSNRDGLDVRCKDCRNIRYNKADPRRVFAKIYNSQIEHSVARGHPAPNYTLDQLKGWVDQQPNTWQLWQDYVASGYQNPLRPSVDRLDDSLPYTLDNLRLTTWQENRQRGADAKRAGTLNSNQRAVRAYNQDGSLHAEYHSIMEAVRAVNGRMWGISSVANGKPVKKPNGSTYIPKTYKGFIWKWAT